MLAGFEVPHDEHAAFERFLDELGYDYELDEGNDAYRRFLGRRPVQSDDRRCGRSRDLVRHPVRTARIGR